MVLSNKQREDLNKAILGYLKSSGYEGAFEALTVESGISEEEAVDEKYAKLLEKKWTAIIRLQKKILQLEAQVSALQQDLQAFGSGKKTDKSEVLPREPAKHTLHGHRMPVTRVLFHPVFNVVVSAGEDSAIKVWDYETGQFERTLKGHTDAVQDLAFNADGTMLASCSADLSIKLWDFEQSSCVKTLNGHDHNVSCVIFLPSGNTLVSCSRDKTIKVWDIASGYCTRTFSGHDAWVRQIRVNSDASILASCSMDQTIKIWNFKTGECVRTFRDHDHVIETIEFSNSHSAEANLKTLTDVKATNGTKEEAASDDASKAENADLESKKDDGSTPTGAYLVSGSRDKTIRIWEVSTGRCLKVLNGHDNWVRSVVFHPSGRYLLSSADDKSIRVWDLTKNARMCKVLENAHPLFVSTVDWNKSTPMLASGGVDHSVKIWECR